MKMNYLEKLLQGQRVEWKTLGEVVNIRHGRDWKNLEAGGIPVYGSGGIMGYVNKYTYQKETVLIPRKGTITNLFYVNEPFWNVDTIYYTEIDTSQIIPKFLYYFLKTIDFMQLDTGSGRPSLTQAILNRLQIPIPPLPVQKEIVKILDALTALTSELTSELTLRQKQYQYYRDKLLTFGDEVEWKTLGEVAVIGTGSHDTQDAIDDGDYIFYARGISPLRLNTYDFDEIAIITAGDGVGVGKVFHWAVGRYALHQRAYRIAPNSDVSARYIYYYMVTNFYSYIQKNSVSSSVTSLRKPMFLKFPIPIPPLSEQKRIVEILDKFDILTNSITEGLPKEIELRNKQYEYYREMLLGF